MKNLIIISFFLFIGLGNTWGQPGKHRAATMEKVAAYRVEFFNQNLELTEVESAKFWPIYNDYRAKEKSIKKRGESKRRVELMSDEEIENYLINHLENEQKILDLKKEFFREIKNVLPARKAAMIPRVEKQFRKEILSEMRKKRRTARLGN